MSGESKNLFVSHSYLDDAVLQGLKAALEKAGYIVEALPHDGPKPKDTAVASFTNEMPSAPCIDRAEALIVLVSPGLRTMSEVNSEVEYAERRGKRIVGVYVRGGRETDLPANFQKYGDALVSWPSTRVMEALDGTLNIWLRPDGETPVSERDIERFTCGEPVPE
ncbi:TIR domain-containing protein [Corallococcus aberystwythensis]|uniref:TIR domain-containing protein n=1 Tax=Corallococcus aberystwythensis TaxID=2316722 RepID=UPI00131539AF|nr:TIR domain-containing protein [Corallococcus aberystwythensis]